MKRFDFTTIGIVIIVVFGLVSLSVFAGSLSPSASPASTFYTLSQIFNPLASTSYDSSGFSADQNGSLIEMLKYTNNNLNWLGVAGNTTYTSKAIQVGSTATVSYSRFGTSTTTHSNYISSANDLLISGDLQVNATVSFGSFASIGNTLFIDATNKRVGIGTNAPAYGLSVLGAEINVTQDAGPAVLSMNTNSNTSSGAGHLQFNRSRGTVATPLIVSASDEIGQVRWRGYDGSGYENAADISAYIDGSPGADSMPTKLYFAVTPAGSNSLSTRMVILSNGNIGIGTTAPSTKFEVQGTSSASYGLFGALQVAGFSSTSYSRFGTNITGHSNYISASNDLLISGDLEVDGSASFAGSASVSGTLYLPKLMGGPSTDTVCFDSSNFNALIKCSSSERYKDNIEPLVFEKEKLLSINPVSFTWKQGGAESVGLIAEQVADYIPDLTFKDDDGQIGGVRYQILPVYLLSLAKEHELRLDALDAGGNTTFGTSVLSESNESLIASILDYFENTLVKIKKLIVKEIVVENITVTKGMTIIDEVTGEPYCVVMSNGQLTPRQGECGATTPSALPLIDKGESEGDSEPTPEPEPTQEPPVEVIVDPEIVIEVTEPPVIESTE